MAFRTRRRKGRIRRLAVILTASLIAASSLAPPSHAQQSDRTSNPDSLLAAVVKVSTKVPAEARTANGLGTEREGSGVVIDSSGLVLTIGYLILEAETVEVELAGARKVPARIIAYDHDTGFGLIRALGELDVKPVELGESGRLEVRDRVLVASFGGHKMSMPAIVVSRRPFAGSWEYLLENAIFTVPAHPSFGGAALFGSDGTLLGIGSLIVGDAAGPGAQIAGNMFVPIDRLKPILADLLERGRAEGPYRPWLGVYSDELRGRLFVSRVAADGPASSAGIEPGDMLIGVNGKPVSGLADFYRKVWAAGDAGVTVKLDVLKGTTISPVPVKSTDRYRWLRLDRSY